MIASDIDGTLLDYGSGGQVPPKINYECIKSLRLCGVREIVLVTNQGGLPFSMNNAKRADGRQYPIPEAFCLRLKSLIDALEGNGIRTCAIRVCVFHPAASRLAIEQAAVRTRNSLRFFGLLDKTIVYTTERARKPSPLMLRSVEAAIYYGDDDCDAEASANAGIAFYKVERFV